MSDSPYQPAERRPIASRNLRVIQRLATLLVRWKITANSISVIGMFCAIAGGASLTATAWIPDWQRPLWLLAALMVQLRLLANLLDGMVAIESRLASAVGELYNEIPDRISDAAILIGLGYASGGDSALGYVAACVAIFTAYVRAMGKVAGAGQEFCGPMAKPQRMFVVTVVALFLGLTPASWHILIGEPPTWGFASAALVLIILGGTATAVRRLYRIAETLKRSP